MRYLIPLVFFFLPLSSHAALLFSEIAWMGTDQSADDEWIELFNHDMSGGGPLDVTGWTLSDGGDISIELSGTIPPMTIIVLERTDDSTVPGVTAFQTYTGSLANTGETLTLRNSEGTVVAEVVGGTDWSSIGGRNAPPKLTPQQGMAGWVTGTPTPGAENVAHDETDTEDDTEENEDDDDDTETANGGTTKKSSGDSNKRTSIVESTAELTLTLTAPDVAYVNQPVSFTTVATGPGRDIVNSLVYTWNFGDTYGGEGKAPVHTYAYPGEYVVVVNARYSKHDVTVEKTIRILPVGVTVTRTREGDVVLTNTAPQEIDISGYTLKGTETLVLPPHTRLLKGGSITIAKERVIPDGVGMIALYDRDRVMLASEASVQRASLASTPTVANFFTSAQTRTAPVAVAPPAKPSASPVSTKKEDVVRGEVQGTSTVLSGLTIPVYAAEDEAILPTRSGAYVAPYVGLVVVLVVGILLLYRRGGADGHG